MATLVLVAGSAVSVCPAETVDQMDLSAPGIVAAGQGDWLWLLWLGAGGKDEKSGQPTRITAKVTNKPWAVAQEKYLPRVRAVAARGDHLDVFLPDGRHFLYDAQGESRLLDPLPKGLRPVSLSADGERLYVLAVRDRPVATTAPGAATPRADSAPTTGAALGPNPWRLLSQELGAWKTIRPDPPSELTRARLISLTVHLFHPTVLGLVDDRLVVAELIEPTPARAPEPDASGVGTPSRGPQWRTTTLQQPQDDAMPLADLKAVSVNQQLYVIGWPAWSDRGAMIHQVEKGKLIEVGELPPALAGAAGTLAGRHRKWDLAASGRRLVLVRHDPSGPGLRVRRFDPEARRFEDDWQPVTGLDSGGDWMTHLPPSRVFTIAVIAVVVLMFLVRRPTGTIRLPVEVEPARLPFRIAAFLIDWAPCSLGAYLVVYGPAGEAYQQASRALMGGRLEDPQLMKLVLLTVGGFLLYQVLAETLFATTVGKRLFRLSVCSVQGVRANPLQVLMRNLLKALELPVWPVVLLLVIIHPARQRLGDILAGTIVVGPRRRPIPPWVLPPTAPPGRDAAPPTGDDQDDEGPADAS